MIDYLKETKKGLGFEEVNYILLLVVRRVPIGNKPTSRRGGGQKVSATIVITKV